MTLSFFVPGTPKAQPRPRAFARNFGGKWQARVYDASTAEGWKAAIAVAAKPFLPSEPLVGPVELHIDFYMPRPKSHSTKKGLRPAAPNWHTQKPDIDNLEKAVMDALTQIGMWSDDSQVCVKQTTKFWSSEKSGARIVIGEPEYDTHPTTNQLEIL
jgi:Holliday junction resolvase RusA-like endonuclease